jgi:hypothetical protein
VPDLVVDLVECVSNSAPLLLAVAGASGWLLVRATRRIGFRSGAMRLRWPHRAQRVGRRVVIPVGRVPRRHRAAAGAKQW